MCSPLQVQAGGEGFRPGPVPKSVAKAPQRKFAAPVPKRPVPKAIAKPGQQLPTGSKTEAAFRMVAAETQKLAIATGRLAVASARKPKSPLPLSAPAKIKAKKPAVLQGEISSKLIADYAKPVVGNVVDLEPKLPPSPPKIGGLLGNPFAKPVRKEAKKKGFFSL